MTEFWRRWQASWRDTFVLLREFAGPLFFFLLVMGGSGWLFYYFSAQFGQPIASYPEAIYDVLTMSFLQPAGGAFPQHWILQLFYFIMPVIGVGLVATGLADFGVLLFNRRARSKEWEMAVASTFHQHTVLVGLGHLGYWVLQNLNKVGEQVVVIETDSTADLVTTVKKMNIPVIQDDATRQPALDAAGVRRAKAIVLCSQNDAMNLQIAVKARTMNPGIRVVVRIFDPDFAQSLQQQFGFIALSATSMSAPAFAAAATGVDITQPITVEGVSLSLAQLSVAQRAKFRNKTVAQTEEKYDISIVLLKHAGEDDLHPAGERVIHSGDKLAVLGSPTSLNTFVHDNH